MKTQGFAFYRIASEVKTETGTSSPPQFYMQLVYRARMTWVLATKKVYFKAKIACMLIKFFSVDDIEHKNLKKKKKFAHFLLKQKKFNKIA